MTRGKTADDGATSSGGGGGQDATRAQSASGFPRDSIVSDSRRQISTSQPMGADRGRSASRVSASATHYGPSAAEVLTFDDDDDEDDDDDDDEDDDSIEIDYGSDDDDARFAVRRVHDDSEDDDASIEFDTAGYAVAVGPSSAAVPRTDTSHRSAGSRAPSPLHALPSDEPHELPRREYRPRATAANSDRVASGTVGGVDGLTPGTSGSGGVSGRAGVPSFASQPARRKSSPDTSIEFSNVSISMSGDLDSQGDVSIDISNDLPFSAGAPLHHSARPSRPASAKGRQPSPGDGSLLLGRGGQLSTTQPIGRPRSATRSGTRPVPASEPSAFSISGDVSASMSMSVSMSTSVEIDHDTSVVAEEEEEVEAEVEDSTAALHRMLAANDPVATLRAARAARSPPPSNPASVAPPRIKPQATITAASRGATSAAREASQWTPAASSSTYDRLDHAVDADVSIEVVDEAQDATAALHRMLSGNNRSASSHGQWKPDQVKFLTHKP